MLGENKMVKYQKITKWICLFLLHSTLIIGCFLLGVKNVENRIQEEEREQTVTGIAIVNLDQGVVQKDNKIFYSSELLDLNSDYLVVENLETARQGINNGTYAAYIVIPSQFSHNAISINQEPQKAVLEFAMNPNLREDISRLTMANIKNFEIGLNTNMSYMYVQAILEEFHNAQDGAEIILSNDDAEKVRIDEMNPDALLSALEYTPYDLEDPQIDEVNFDGILKDNIEISGELKKNYDQFVSDGKEKLNQIKEGETTVVQEMDDFADLLGDVHLDRDGEESVYAEGLQELENYVKKYEEELADQRVVIASMVEMAPIVSPTATPTETPTPTPIPAATEMPMPSVTPTETPTQIPVVIKQMLMESLEDINNEIYEMNQQNKQQIDEIKKMISGETGTEPVELVEDSEETLTEELPNIENETLMDEPIKESIEEKLDNIETMRFLKIEDVYKEEIIEESLKQLVKAIDELPQFDSEGYENIVKQQVVQPIDEKIKTETARVQEEGSKCMESVQNYWLELSKVDMYQFYDQEKTDSLIINFTENVVELEKQIIDSQTEYQKYGNYVYLHASETMEDMQEQLGNAYDGTSENVQNEIDLLKEYRNNMNVLNSEILQDFSKKLPYTRVGNLEYVQAYDFIVKPIELSDESVARSKINLVQNDIFMIRLFFIMLSLWSISIVVLLIVDIYPKLKRRNE